MFSWFEPPPPVQVEAMAPLGLAMLAWLESGRPEYIYVHFDKGNTLQICHREPGERDLLLQHYAHIRGLAHGRVVDIGSGSGVIAEKLQGDGIDISALENCPPSVRFLHKIGISNILAIDVFDLDQCFDTILITDGTLGLVGNGNKLGDFLAFLSSRLNPGGQILIEDVDGCYVYHEWHGHMSFKEYVGDSFDWVNFSSAYVMSEASRTGLKCELIDKADNCRYLLRLHGS